MSALLFGLVELGGLARAEDAEIDEATAMKEVLELHGLPPAEEEPSSDPTMAQSVEGGEGGKEEVPFLELFTAKSYRYTGGSYVDREFHYQLFVPELSEEVGQLPLIVWLHGAGEWGDDNLKQLLHLDRIVFTPPRERERFPFFLLAVQCVPDNAAWTSGGDATVDMIDVVVAIVEETLREYPIDPDRVSVSGVSAGGGGTWQIAMRYPEYFSAAAPMASSGAGGGSLKPLKGLPIWAFHSLKDQMTSIEGVRATVADLQSLGGEVTLTEVNVSPTSQLWEHDAWTEAFADYGLLDWLLAQRRGDAVLTPEWHLAQRKYFNWEYVWPRAAFVLFLLVVAYACWQEQRRRARVGSIPTTG